MPKADSSKTTFLQDGFKVLLALASVFVQEGFKNFRGSTVNDVLKPFI